MLEFFAILEQAKVADARRTLEALARDKEFLAPVRDRGRHRRGLPVPRHLPVPDQREAGDRARAPDHAPPEVWNELVSKHPRDTAKLKDKLGWSDRDILTMASIVEKEAVEASERPRIAQVFINRLTVADVQAAASCRPIRRSATAAWSRCRSRPRASRGTSRVSKAEPAQADGLRSPAPRAARRQGQPVQHVRARGPAARPDREPGQAPRSRRRCRPTAATTSSSSRPRRARAATRSRRPSPSTSATSQKYVGTLGDSIAGARRAAQNRGRSELADHVGGGEQRGRLVEGGLGPDHVGGGGVERHRVVALDPGRALVLGARAVPGDRPDGAVELARLALALGRGSS